MTHIKLVCDDGSNFIKTAYIEKGETVLNSFPSRVTRGASLNMDCEYSSAAYSTSEQVYSVTKSAEQVIPTDHPNYQTSDVNRVLIHHALRECGATSADIVLTLPVSQFFTPQGAKNEALIKSKIENVKQPITAMDGKPCATINKVFVMPEGVPAFAHAREELNLSDGRYLIADIGGTTTDLVAFDDDNNIEKYLSLDIGALSMLDRFKAIMSAKLNTGTVPDSLVLQGLLHGKTGAFDLKKEAQECIKLFESEIKDNIGKLGELALFDTVIYSGGGAKLLTLGDNVKITSNPQFDNAIGNLQLFEG